jgi:hypothetical protein
MKKQVLKCKECDIMMFPVDVIGTAPEPVWSSCPFCGLCSEKIGKYPFCKTCKVVYQIGCPHWTDGVQTTYNASIMTGYDDGGKTHAGMLVFHNNNLALQFMTDKNVTVRFKCTCKNSSHECKKTRGVAEVCRKDY